MRLLYVALATGVLVSTGACGLSVTGSLSSGDDTGPTPPGPVGEDGGALPVDGSTAEGGGIFDASCGAATCALPPESAGFSVVLFGATTACPTGFDPIDVVENPTAGAGACGCGACTKSGTNCNTGTIPTYYDQGGGACGTQGANHDAFNGQCKAQSGVFGQNASVGAPVAIPGTCSAPGAPARANVTTEAKRICAPTGNVCPDDACKAAAPLQACLVHEGDATCPAEAPNKHLVGTDFDLACDACGCTVSATCSGSLGFYPQSGCNGTHGVLPVTI